MQNGKIRGIVFVESDAKGTFPLAPFYGMLINGYVPKRCFLRHFPSKLLE